MIIASAVTCSFWVRYGGDLLLLFCIDYMLIWITGGVCVDVWVVLQVILLRTRLGLVL